MENTSSNQIEAWGLLIGLLCVGLVRGGPLSQMSSFWKKIKQVPHYGMLQRSPEVATEESL